MTFSSNGVNTQCNGRYSRCIHGCVKRFVLATVAATVSATIVINAETKYTVERFCDPMYDVTKHFYWVYLGQFTHFI